MRYFSLLLAFVVVTGNGLLAQTNDIFVHADKMPYFSGCTAFADSTEEKRRCSDAAIVQFIASKLQYPEAAMKQELEGTVYVSFIIDERGAIEQSAVLKDIGGGCGEEALRVIRLMPPWEPAVNAGKNVKARLNLPIRFDLRNDAFENPKGYALNWGALKGGRASKKDIYGQLKEPLNVRDEMGNLMKVNELMFTVEHKNKEDKAQSNGVITKKMERMVSKLKKGDTFTVTATVQKGGEFRFVERSFVVE